MEADPLQSAIEQPTGVEVDRQPPDREDSRNRDSGDAGLPAADRVIE